MNINDCTQPIPTQIPSISLAPTTYWVEFEYRNFNVLCTGYEVWETTVQIIESDIVVVNTWIESNVVVVKPFLRVYEDTYV